MSLFINLATRGRPEMLRATIERTLPNISRSDTELMVSIDDDDQATLDAIKNSWPAELIHRSNLSIEPREDTLGAKYNRCLDYPADVYLAMVDYAPQITPGFDEKILEAAAVYPDGYCVIFNDMNNLSFPNSNAVTRKLIDKMGFFYPPYYPYWFIDHWFDDIARMIDRIVYADFQIDTSKRPGTQEMREAAWWGTFFDAGYIVRRENAHAIIKSDDFIETPARKTALLRNHRLVEQRSIMVNNDVRARSAAWDAANKLSHDERYLRCKAAAKELMKQWLPGLDADEAA